MMESLLQVWKILGMKQMPESVNQDPGTREVFEWFSKSFRRTNSMFGRGKLIVKVGPWPQLQ